MFLRIASLLLYGFLAGCALAAPEALRPQAVAPGVYVLLHAAAAATPDNGGYVGNRGFLVGSSGVVVINPGPSKAYGLALSAAIRRITALPVVAVIDSHARPEQVLANQVFRDQGVPLLASAGTAALMAQRCEHCLEQSRQDAGAAALDGTRIALPKAVLQDGQQLELGGRQLLVRVFPAGMIPGQTLILDQRSGVLFTGLALSLEYIPTLRDADIGAAIAALDEIPAMNARLVVPDRGPVAAPARVAQFRAYLEQLQTQVGQAYDQGLSAMESVSAVPLPEFAGWTNYPSQHPANVLGLHLRLEQSAP